MPDHDLRLANELELPELAVRFLRFADGATEPAQADCELGGAVSLRARRFCSPFLTASALGWFVYPPIDFSLVWTGAEFYWRPLGAPHWIICDRIYLPGFVERYQRAAPPALQAHATAFLEIFPEQGAIQVWSGWAAGTSPGWNLWSCAPINRPQPTTYRILNAVIESDWWPGPLITVLQFQKTDVPVNFRTRRPLFQAVPVPYAVQNAARDSRTSIVTSLDDFTDEDWRRHGELYGRRNSGRPGDYARMSRQRDQAARRRK